MATDTQPMTAINAFHQDAWTRHSNDSVAPTPKVFGDHPLRTDYNRRQYEAETGCVSSIVFASSTALSGVYLPRQPEKDGAGRKAPKEGMALACELTRNVALKVHEHCRKTAFIL